MFSAESFRLSLLCLLGFVLCGQASIAVAQPAGATGAQSQAQEPLETLQVDVNVVNVFCNVKDKRGALISTLKQEDFELYEDKVKQTIKYFSAETDQPLTMGILVDASGSQQRVLGMEQPVGGAFLQQVLRPK